MSKQPGNTIFGNYVTIATTPSSQQTSRPLATAMKMMKAVSGAGAFSKRLIITQNNVTQQIFEERKKTISGILQKTQTMQMQASKANAGPSSAYRQRTKTPNGRTNKEMAIVNEDINDANTGA